MQVRQNIFRFLFINLLLCVTLTSTGQADSTKRVGGLSFGIDLSRFLVSIWEPIGLNMEFQASIEAGNSFSLVVEGGWLTSNISEETYDYELKGSYYRLGGLFNVLKREPNDLSAINVGLLYGFSPYWHKADHIQIKDKYWGEGSGSLPMNNLFSHWLEINAGIRVEIFKNWMMGWKIRTKFRISRNEDPIMTPYLTPGFGKGDKNFSLGLSYYLVYRIPYKKRK